MKATTANKIRLLLVVIPFLAVTLKAVDVRQNPLSVAYCDGSSLEIYPYSAVVRSDNSTFNCYEVQISPAGEGLRIGFEDADDADFNDVIIDLWVTGNGSGAPVAHVRFVSKDASYSHTIHLVSNGTDLALFKAEDTAPGAVFDMPLPVKPCPDQTGVLLKEFTQASAFPGQEIEMTLTLKNNTVIDFGVITILDDLPPYLAYLGDDARVPARRNGNQIAWTLPGLGAGETARIAVRLQIAEDCPAGEIVNLGRFIHDAMKKPLLSNPAVIRVESWQLQLRKTVSNSQARPGDTLEYRIAISNPAAQPLPVARLLDTLAAELELVSQQSSLSFQQQGSTLLWIGEIPAGKETSVSFRARVRDDVVAGTVIANRASLESAVLPEPLLSNSVSTTVVSDPIATAQVRFSKKADTPQSEVGRIIRFRLVTENRSPSLLLAPRLEDSLPQGFDYVPGSSACDGIKLADPQSRSRLNWQIPAIRPGQTSVLSFQVVIGADVRRGRNINRAVFTALDQSGQNLRLEAEEFVNISSTTLVFYSAVEGSVFLDRDNDESYSPADTPLSGIEVRLSNGQLSLTDAGGRYSFQSLFPGDYALGLNQATLPEKYRVVFPATKAVTLFDGLTDTVDFAVTFTGDDETPLSRLQGRVFFDKVRNQAFDAGEPLLADFTVMLDGSLQTTGKDGVFVFSKLPPGKHALAITFGGQTVRRDVTLPPGQTALDIPLPFSGIVITVQGEN
jgi:uncharacterized repeat protein (TIGR01451 family)